MGENLGQHFLNDDTVVADIVNAANLQSGEHVLEVGPGEGVLTHALLKTGVVVQAIEKDPRLATNLKNNFADQISNQKLSIETADVRDIDANLLPKEYKVVANIPYYLTSELLRQLLTASNQPNQIVVLIQKEVAERIVAKNEKESVLSLSVKAYGKPEIVRTVPASAFSPPPNVESAILSISNINRDFFENTSENDFFALIKAGFQHKRKKLTNNLESKCGKQTAKQALKKLSFETNIRAEKLKLRDWKPLLQALNL